MQYNNITLNVLIKGRVINEYPHNGQVFVEGRANSEFELEVKNHNHHRVEVILSVDGLAITDGKEAGPNSTGYLIDAGGSVRIPGWKLNEGNAAAFEFTGKGKSYAQAATGSSLNTGVIGLMAFSEKVRAPVWNAPTYASTGWPFYNGQGIGTCSMGGSESVAMGAVAMNAVSHEPRTGGGIQSRSKGAMRGITISASCADPEPVQNLGTGFGAAMEFNTSTVSFDRGDLISTIVLYYDDAVGLRKRGIEVSRKRTGDKQLPNAFPGMSGCIPPDGWNG